MASVPSPQIAREDEPFTLSIVAEDPDSPHGDVLSYSVVPTFLTISTTGVLSFTPGNEHVGDHQVTVTVSDQRSTAQKVSFELRVENVNDPPWRVMILRPDEGDHVPAGLVVFHGEAADPDVGDQLEYRWSVDGELQGSGPIATIPLDAGERRVTLVVTDREGATATAEVVVVADSTADWNTPAALSFLAILLSLGVAAFVLLTPRRHRGSRSGRALARKRRRRQARRGAEEEE